MSDKVIQVKIEANENLSAAATKADGALDKLEKNIKDGASELGNFDRGIAKASTSLRGLAGAFVGGIVIGGIAELVSHLGEIAEYGDSVGDVTRTFEALAGKIGDSDAVLNALRTTTSGVVTDFQLMSNATTLLQLGMARNSDELAEMLGLATQLGDVDAFISVMKNGAASAEMLDNIGVSSARVKELLKEMGATASDTGAYGAAVMQAMRESVSNLGSAVDENIDSVDLLKTAWGNWADEASRKIGDVANALADVAVDALGIKSGTQIAAESAATEAANAYAQRYTDELIKQLGDSMEQLGTELFTVKIGADTLQIDQRGLAREFAVAMQTATANGLDADPTAVLDSILRDWGIYVDEIPLIADSLVANYQYLIDNQGYTLDVIERNLLREDTFIARAARARKDTLSKMLVGVRGFSAEYSSQFEFNQALAGMRQLVQVEQDAAAARDAIHEANQAQLEFNRALGMTAGTNARADLATFFTAAAQAAGDLSADVMTSLETQFEHLQKLADEGLISQADVDRAGAIRDHLVAVSQMSFSDLMGVGGGGVRGEIGAMVMAQLGGMGLGDGKLANIERIFNLGSGRETGLSVAVEDKVIPMLASMAAADPELADRAILNLEQTLKKMAEAGLTLDDQLSIITNEWMAAWGGGGDTAKSFTIKPGDTASSLAAQFGVSVDEILRSAGAKNARSLLPGTYNLGGGFGGYGMIDRGLDWSSLTGEADAATLDTAIQAATAGYEDIKTAMSDIRSETDATVDKWSAFTANPHTLLLNIETIIPPELKKLLNMMGEAATFGTKPLRGSPTGRNVVLVD